MVRLVEVPQLLGLLPKALAHAQLTIMEMPAPVIVLLARMAVSLLLGTRIPLHLACALLANGPHLEAMTMVHALIALLILQPRLLESLPLLIATAWKTSMETPKPPHALLVQIAARLMLSHQQLPLQPLIVHAQ